MIIILIQLLINSVTNAIITVDRVNWHWKDLLQVEHVGTDSIYD